MSHHRQHALGYLSEAALAFHAAEVTVAEFLKSKNTIDKEDLEKYMVYAAFLWEDLVAVATQLGDPTSNLDDIRKRMSRANAQKARAAVSHARYVIHYVSRLGADASVLAGMAVVWENLDFAQWHIIDAIREEIYNDPAFSE